MSKFIGFFIAIFLVSLGHAQDPYPQLFQTWYLYAEDADLVETQYYYGENAPQMTINEDLSFTAIENCWEMSGSFNYLEGIPPFEFFLETQNYEAQCVFGGSNTTVLSSYYQYFKELGGFIYENDVVELHMLLPNKIGFELTFRNQITLSAPENKLQKIAIAPNPAQESITISGISAAIQHIKITDVTGALVQDYNRPDSNTCNISQLPTGLYFIQITAEGQSIVQKFLKQ